MHLVGFIIRTELDDALSNFIEVHSSILGFLCADRDVDRRTDWRGEDI